MVTLTKKQKENLSKTLFDINGLLLLLNTKGRKNIGILLPVI